MVDLLTFLSLAMIVSGTLTFFALIFGFEAGYGRYVKSSQTLIPARIAWTIQESPTLFLPFWYLFSSNTLHGSLLNLLLVIHYFNRTVIFPSKMKSKNGSPVYIVFLATFFCLYNGYLQGTHNAFHCHSYGDLNKFPVFAGIIVFFIGMYINQQSDEILLNLRKPGETDYKIPHGGLFEVVSCPNYFGEIIEWIGYALAASSLPAFSFAYFTICNIGPRALSHHQWYKNKFEDYPKDRKALIPYIL